jgi:hypothetical protein
MLGPKINSYPANRYLSRDIYLFFTLSREKESC